MSFVNNYTPPEPAASLSDPYGPEPWDINFIFPVPPAIENDVVKLIPFVPRLHLAAYWAAGADDPALYEYLTNLHTTPQRMLEHVLHGREDPGWCTFLVIDKSKPEADESRGLGGAVAGTMAYVNTSAAQRMTEIGAVIIVKSAQRSHVASNAAGLLMSYALNLPSDPAFPGLGLRRVVWSCHAENTPSQRLAQRLGFQHEGTLRWYRVGAAGRPGGIPTRAGDPVQRNGRHDVFFSVCWDDWEEGGRAIVEEQMARRS